MTKPTEYDARQSLEQAARAARECGASDYLRDLDDLAPARPLVWLVLAWLAIIAALAMILMPFEARSAELWGVVNAASWHDDRECPACPGGKPNERNWGGGLEARFAHDLGLQVGGYRNTYGRGTAYAIGMWQPVTAGPLAAGGFLGAATGYAPDPSCGRNLCAVAGLMFTLTVERFGLNVMVVPPVTAKSTAVVGVQLRMRLTS